MKVWKIYFSDLFLLSSLNILPTLKVLITVVYGPRLTPKNILRSIPNQVPSTIVKSKTFHFSLKYYLPKAIIFIRASNVKSPLKKKLIISRIFLT